MELVDSRHCRVCGCTERDCRRCMEKSGAPCYWVEWNLCSVCAEEIVQRVARVVMPLAKRKGERKIEIKGRTFTLQRSENAFAIRDHIGVPIFYVEAGTGDVMGYRAPQYSGEELVEMFGGVHG